MALSPDLAQRLQSLERDFPALPLEQARLPALGEEHLFVTVDTLNVDVHFRAGDDPSDIGFKSLAVNLSDLAAMGAQARWVSLALRTPDDLGCDWFDGFCAGFDHLAQHYGVRVCAVTFNAGPLSITVQALGTAPPGQGLRRCGARAGDRVMVSGTLGDAAYALRQRLAGNPVDVLLQRRLDRPEPRLDLGMRLRGLASSAIDISDGLCADLGHVLEASGVGARLRAPCLPLSDALRAVLPPAQAWPLALAGGDDYELCFTVPPKHRDTVFEAAREAGVVVHDVGEITAASGLDVRDDEGRALVLGDLGYDHFSV